MNTSKLESTWSQEIDEYMYERYGIDIGEVVCDAVREAEDAEIVRIMKQIAQKILEHKNKNTPEKN